MKRFAIYFFYDKDGIVDDYNIFLLENLKKNVSDILVVCNGNLNKSGRDKFSKITDKILLRENIGFDVWGFKEGMLHVGWDRLESFDEVILLNHTNYGPIYDLKIMFDEMSKREIDFWGVVMRHAIKSNAFPLCKYGYIPDHIPSSFIVIRNKLISSKDFQDYWNNMIMINNYVESVCYHEAVFTKDFTDKGYKCDCYVECEDLRDFHDYALMMYPLELVKNRKCPIFKRKNFYNIYEELFNTTYGQSTMEFYDYLKNETSYDVNLIWDNILRLENMYDIKNRMQLNYILPSNISKPIQNKKIGLLMHIYYEEKVDICLKYAESMPKGTDIYITTSSNEKKIFIQDKLERSNLNNFEVSVIENRGRDVSSFVLSLKDKIMNYDYMCFAHDKKVIQLKPYSVGEAFEYRCFDNILSSKEFVENVICLFDENPRIGMLSPPLVYHNNYYQTIGREWGDNFEETLKLAKRLNVNVDISADKPSVCSYGTMFWFRPKAFKKLFEYNFSYNDFPKEPTNENDGNILHAFERVYPFIAQSEGYYSGWLCSDKTAKSDYTNYNYMIREFNLSFFSYYGLNDRSSMNYLVGHPINDGKEIELSRKTLFKILVKRTLPPKIYYMLWKISQIFIKF